ncbi:Homeodomain-interacting protein kinase 2 [Nibea albiflora]|uniref:Homeodomain-interacting protein kinase 2 n=1 Tax=Nibea albiflora TaxID=240163 RepID=A0ACB7F033_NIBAL|nr:Homeodomain-interacting protein kinase 2 [Nibea albiflora]
MSSSTSLSDNSNENNDYTPGTTYEVQKHDVLYSSTTCYQVIDFSGEGSFGKVARCVNLTTGTKVAVKIHKERGDVSKVIRKEIKMLKTIRTLDADKNNIVNFIEGFRFNSLSCLAFEMLDRSLWDLLEERRWIPLNLNEIRPIIQQLMVAFDALKSRGILHTDLKPDNVMLVNHQDQPFKIKLIDFGLARKVSKVCIGTLMQPTSFRAPEVTLGLPLTEAVDMWGVGCIMGFLYFGRQLFQRDCSYNLIRSIVHLLGQPDDDLLSAGLYSCLYFSLNDDPYNPGFILRSPDEFTEVTGIKPQITPTFFDSVENLEDAVWKYPTQKSDIEFDDRNAFLSLLMSTLDLDPQRRLTPRDSLNNPFLSMFHLKNKIDTSSYLDEARRRMAFSPLNHLESKPKSDEKNDVEKFPNELQVEKNKNNLLQEELEQICISYELLIARYEDDVLKIKEEADALLRDLDNEMTVLQQNAACNLKLSTELKAEREAPQKITSHDDMPLEPTKEAEVSEEMPCEQQETISPALTLEPQQGAEGTLPQTRAEPPSVWKRVRHFLGLRKPKRWKRRREEE